MDNYVEQIVRKPADGKSTALKILIWVADAVICLVAVILMLQGWFIALLLAFGAAYGGYYLVTGLDCEYEYIVTNGEMDVDKIIAKRKRKRLITVKASAFERFGKADKAPEIESGATLVQVCGLSKNETKDYYADFTHNSLGRVRLIFSPEEKVVESLRTYLSRNARVAFERENRE